MMRVRFSTIRQPASSFWILVICCGCFGVVGCRQETASVADADMPPESSTIRRYDGLTDREWRNRLKELGPDVPGVESAIPGLTELAADRDLDPTLRRQATLMLGRIGKPALSALPVLTEILAEEGDENHHPAAWAAKSIALWGPPAKSATPALIAPLNHPETPMETRLACLEALARIGGTHAMVLPSLIQHFRSPLRELPPADQLDLRMAIADALFLIGGSGSTAVPALLEQLDHENDLLRAKIVMALGSMGTSASSAATSLAEKVIFDDAPEVRLQSAFALARMGREGETLLNGLAKDEEDRVRALTAEALGMIDSPNENVEESLLKLAKDQDERVRLNAARSLKKLPNHRLLVIEILADLILSAERRTRIAAGDILQSIEFSEKEWTDLELKLQTEADADAQRILRTLQQRRRSN